MAGTILGVFLSIALASSHASDVTSHRDPLDAAVGPPGEWRLIGPTPWTSDGLPENILEQTYAGRVTAVVGDPTDVKTIYLGAFGGGVWKTTDQGQNWRPLTDTADSLNIGCLDLNGTTLYAGTVAATSRSAIGILKSSDAGASWTTVGRDVFDRHSVLRLVTEPNHPEVVYAAVGELQTQGAPGGKGVWKSTNGGLDWTQVTSPSLPESPDVSFNDLAIDPRDPRRVYATASELSGPTQLNGVWATGDAGAHWTRLLNPRDRTPELTAQYTTKIALAPASPNVIYVASADAPNPLGRELDQLSGKLSVFKSEDSGESWTILPTPPGAGCPSACKPLGGNAYTLTLAVDPSDPQVVYLADNKRDGSLSISTDGGATWSDHHIDRYGYTPHADHRAAAFDALGNYLEGDDGGIARYFREEDRWEDFNSTLSITQFNAIQVHPTDPQIVYGGGIDSGLNWKNSDALAWRQLPLHLAMGDLASVRIDRQRPEMVFAQFTGCQTCTTNVLQRSFDSGRTFEEAHAGIAEVGGGVPPFAIDPATAGHVILATSRLYESRDAASTWRPIFAFDQRADTVAIGGGADVIYVWVNNRGALASHNHGASFQPAALTPERRDPFTGIAVSPRTTETAYAVGAGLDHPNVYATRDGGRSWQSIHNNLPNASANAIVVDGRGSRDTLYAALDGGVYISSDEGASWSRFGSGLPNGSAKALDINTSLGVLVVGLNGRGAWQIRIGTPSS